MKKISLILLTLTLFAMLTSCDNSLFNASGISVSKITIENLPEDGNYALAGAFLMDPDKEGGPGNWSNTYLGKASENGTVTWTFTTPLEVKVGSGEFKIVKSGSWDTPELSAFNGSAGNGDIFKGTDVAIDGGTYEITWDATKAIDECITGIKQ